MFLTDFQTIDQAKEFKDKVDAIQAELKSPSSTCELFFP